MRAYLMAGLAIAAVATPAMGRDHAPYLGVEGGILFPRTTDYNVSSTRTVTTTIFGPVTTSTATTVRDGFISRYKRGVDIDAIAGYDFGFFRLEGELGYKRARLKSFTVAPAILSGINTIPIGGVSSSNFNYGNRTTVLSGMINGLVDFGIVPGISVYGGGGVGRARVKTLGARDNVWAYQLIAGLSTAISSNIDVGLKYRYFQTSRLHINNSATFTGVVPTTSSVSAFNETGKFRSHSLLLSLAYNFGGGVAPPLPVVEVAPPPPPPPLPATQTCADGSVISASEICPAPPPPPLPPPPPPAPERG